MQDSESAATGFDHSRLSKAYKTIESEVHDVEGYDAYAINLGKKVVNSKIRNVSD